jgi:hypothetical protein
MIEVEASMCLLKNADSVDSNPAFIKTHSRLSSKTSGLRNDCRDCYKYLSDYFKFVFVTNTFNENCIVSSWFQTVF